MISEVLTDAFKSSLRPVGLMFEKPTPKKKKTMRDYAERAKKRISRRLVRRRKVGRSLTLRELVRKADTIFNKWIRNRDGNHCVTPDKDCKSYIQASHMIKSGRKMTRWEETNVHAQCQHHNYNHDQGFHPSPEILTNYVINKYGIEEYNRLFKLSRIDAPSSWVRIKAEEVIKKYG